MSVKSLATAFALTCGLTCGLAGAAHAAPLSVASPVTLPGVETVAYGCGPGWAPNPWGRCRPMYRRFGGYGYGPRPFYGPPGFYGPRYGYYRPRPPVPFF